MSDKPAEVSTQQKAAASLVAENPQITPEFLQELEAIPPGGFADVLANLEQPKKESVVSAEKTAPEKKETETETTTEAEAEAQTETEAETETETTENPEKPETETAPETEAETEVDPDKKPETEKAETEEAEDPKRIRIHLEKMTPLGKKVAILMRAGLEPEDALAAAKKALNIPDKTTEGKTVPAAEPEELTAAQTELETAETELAEAIGNFDKDATKAALKKVNTARDKVQDTKETVRAAQSHQKLVEVSVNRSKEDYPDAGSFDTPLGELVYSRLTRIAADPSHPLHGDPDAPYKVTEKAAQDLKIPSKKAKPAAPTTLPAKTAAPATRVKPAPPVSGSARTTTQKPDLLTETRAKIKLELGDDAALLDAAVPMLASK